MGTFASQTTLWLMLFHKNKGILNMACNSSTLTSTSGYTVIIPAGCLGETVIELQCKSPQESVYY